MIDLKGKVAVITGSANGLGKALAIELWRQGCNLALLDTDARGLQDLQLQLQNSQQKISIHTIDI
ncbi:MAG TPA: SDR family NAD(P)-dependent oxidoreductase [Chitinophagaceae bacterium]|nr:SDR family NAD(P)-dependent oxidoreductase [Chitinophagaceae bacterium]